MGTMIPDVARSIQQDRLHELLLVTAERQTCANGFVSVIACSDCEEKFRAARVAFDNANDDFLEAMIENDRRLRGGK